MYNNYEDDYYEEFQIDKQMWEKYRSEDIEIKKIKNMKNKENNKSKY